VKQLQWINLLNVTILYKEMYSKRNL